MTRFLGFFLNLLQSPSPEVRVTARLASRDIRTNLGSNLEFLREQTGLNPWETDKQTLMSVLSDQESEGPPEKEYWRCSYLAKLLQEKLFHQYNGDADEEQRVSGQIDSLVIN